MVNLAGLLKPRPDISIQERMVELGNADGLRIKQEAGDTSITDDMISEAESNRKLLIEAGPGYKEARRGW